MQTNQNSQVVHAQSGRIVVCLDWGCWWEPRTGHGKSSRKDNCYLHSTGTAYLRSHEEFLQLLHREHKTTRVISYWRLSVLTYRLQWSRWTVTVNRRTKTLVTLPPRWVSAQLLLVDNGIVRIFGCLSIELKHNLTLVECRHCGASLSETRRHQSKFMLPRMQYNNVIRTGQSLHCQQMLKLCTAKY